MTIKSSRDFSNVILLPRMKSQWEADAWCEQNFGKKWSVVDNRDGVWACFWYGSKAPGTYEWLFKNEADAVLFRLKWG